MPWLSPSLTFFNGSLFLSSATVEIVNGRSELFVEYIKIMVSNGFGCVKDCFVVQNSHKVQTLQNCQKISQAEPQIALQNCQTIMRIMNFCDSLNFFQFF